MKLRAPDEVLELGDVGVHQEEAYPDETMVTGRPDHGFASGTSATRDAPKHVETAES